MKRIDYDSWRRVIEFLIAGGIDGLFVLGGGGELSENFESTTTGPAQTLA
jgi:dihydrodipicolinate synthase/N-acetylneuraminate lyase